MNRIIVATSGLLFLLVLMSGNISDAQEASNSDAPAIESEAVPPADAASDEDAAPEQEASDEAAADETPLPIAAPPEPSQSRARGLRMDKDGFIYGQVVFIDPHSLDQVPVAGAVVTFIQQQSIITQAKTGVDGIFTVKGLAPYATYSMFVRSDAWVGIFGTYVTPEDESEQAAQVSTNRLVFASLQQANNDPNPLDSATGDPKYHAIQVIPWQDFLVAMHLGIFGDVCGQDCGCASCGGAGCAACCGGGVAGGGGGGGGGGTGAGYGAAAAAAFTAAAAAWSSGASNEDGELASPFAP